ncbi:MAG: glycosyltransferase family 2 protein [Bdellovibrionota bacterium]
MDYSVVIPVFNECESLPELLPELCSVLSDVGGDFEILVVDDGSTDFTQDTLKRLGASIPQLRPLVLRRRFGKGAAYAVGFANAKGATLLTLDGDLQDDPKEIPRFIAKLAEGYDLVVGHKVNRAEQEPMRRKLSVVFNMLVSLVFGGRYSDCDSGFRAMRRVVTAELQTYAGRYRFIPVLAAQAGYHVCEIPITQRRRRFGESRYGMKRLWTGLLDLFAVRFLTGFDQSPIHFFGSIGGVLALCGIFLEAYAVFCKLGGDAFRVHITAIVLGGFLALGGLQFVSLGLIGEMFSQRFPKPANHLKDAAEERVNVG